MYFDFKRYCLWSLLSILLICCMLAFFGCANGTVAKERTQNFSDFGILIDAGHGGQDPGAISSINGAFESELNLKVAKQLQSIFEKQRLPCTMTRNNENALADTKGEDMSIRRQIIQSSNSAVMISIHMNSFPNDPNVWGPQVFYYDSGSKELADILQEVLNDATDGNRKSAYLDLFVLKGNAMPSVLIECGFLSNEIEATKLNNAEYQTLIAQTIANGVYKYCGYTNS